jgi:hypothetical protein
MKQKGNTTGTSQSIKDINVSGKYSGNAFSYIGGYKIEGHFSVSQFLVLYVNIGSFE